MPVFGSTSQARLATCHRDLQTIMRRAIVHGPDFAIVCGHRSEAEQERVWREGFSSVRWPDSAHNRDPSEAVDIAPWVAGAIDWDDIGRWRLLGGYVLGVADQLYRAGEVDRRLRWGADWDRDFDEADERGKLRDYPHFELI